MRRNEIVFKVRISHRLRLKIEGETKKRKRKRKKSEYVREQLIRNFKYSQTEIRMLDEICEKIKAAGVDVNSYARKCNTYGAVDFSSSFIKRMSEIKKLYEDALLILSREKNLNYYTCKDESNLKDTSLYVRMPLKTYENIKKYAGENNISAGRAVRSMLLNPLDYTASDFRKILKKMSFEKNKIVTNVIQIKDRYEESDLNVYDIRRFNAGLSGYIMELDYYEQEIRRRNVQWE